MLNQEMPRENGFYVDREPHRNQNMENKHVGFTFKTLGPACVAALISIIMALALQFVTGGLAAAVLIVIAAVAGFVFGWMQAKKD